MRRQTATGEKRPACCGADRALQRELRAAIVRLGARIGLDARQVARFTWLVSGRTLARCGCADLERVLFAYLQLALCVRMRVAVSRLPMGDPRVPQRQRGDRVAASSECVASRAIHVEHGHHAAS
jgi:hypothetical protein